MHRSKSYPNKILTRRYSESQLPTGFVDRQTTVTHDWESLSSSDSESDSGEVNILRIDTSSPRIRRDRPRVTSAFGRTIKLNGNNNGNNRGLSGNERKRLSTTEFWYKLPDERFDSINRLVRPTVATMCREAYTPIRRFRPPEQKMFRSKSDLQPKQEEPDSTTMNLIEATEALQVTDDFAYQKWLNEVDYNDYAQEDELENEVTEQRIAQQNKEHKLRAKRKKSKEEVKNIVNRLYTGSDKNRHHSRRDLNNKRLLSTTHKRESRSESPVRRKSLPEKGSNITLSYMWMGKDSSSQKLHACPVAIKSNARATFDKVSNRFTSIVQY